MADQEQITREHIKRVQTLLADFSSELSRRGIVHDASKWSPEEMEPLKELQKEIDRDGPAEFGSDLYRQRTQKYLSGMTKHHYAANSHHPEHYENGVAGMTLGDLIEMFCDWKAASERNGEAVFNCTSAFDRFGLDPQLRSIFENTARSYGWAVK